MSRRALPSTVNWTERGPMEDTGAKQHSYYCTHRQHVTIGKRAKAAA